jgi:hypothetical protein
VSRLARDPQVEAVVAAYRADLEAAGQYARKEVTSPARSFLLRVGVDGWAGLSLEQQLAVRGHDRRLVTWLIVTGRVRPTPEYLIASKLRVGKVAAWVYREFHARFLRVAAELGFDQKSAELQWWAVARVAALVGVSPERLTKAQLDAGREQLIAATVRLHPDHPIRARPLTTRLHGAEATLFHAGVIDTPPRKRHPDKSAVREQQWAAVPPRLRATLQGYIEQMRLSLRPATIVGVEAVLREFAGWPTTDVPERRGGRRSAPCPHRALQASPGRAAVRPRRAALEDRAGRASRDAARVPGASQRMGRRGRPDAGADVRR